MNSTPMEHPVNRQKTGKPKPRGGKRRTSWKKGQSGNLKGRPVLPEDYKAAMKILDPMATKVLQAVLDDPKHPRRQQAAEYVLNRNHGTPRTRTEVSTPIGKAIEVKVRGVRSMTTEERQKHVDELIAKRAAAAAGAGAGVLENSTGDGEGGE